jgi:branched-subunit amino acid aminotransferase/4-amino-4-deoxychorismate lyase
LPGITRKSIIELAKQRGYEVQERAVAVEEVVDADELFCTVRLASARWIFAQALTAGRAHCRALRSWWCLWAA